MPYPQLIPKEPGILDPKATGNPITTQQGAPLVQQEEGFTFQDLKEKTKNLADKFRDVINRCQTNRLLRKMEVDIDAERMRGKFKPDEIYIPYHVIADNINKEASAYINYLTSSRNVALFKERNSTQITSFEPLERGFTSAVRYEGYEQDIFPLIDGHQLHGVDYLEVCYDDSKPGYFSFEQIGYENVWYPKNVQRGKFQDTPILIRNCEITKQKLLNFPNIRKDQVELLFQNVTRNDPEKEFATIQKVFYRKPDNKIYVCWMSHDKSTDFIRDPQPLFLGRWKITVDPLSGAEQGREQIYEEIYPIVPFPYSISENKHLIETQGRARLDESIQEAVSSIVSSIVNGFHKASQFMWAPKNPTNTSEIEQLDMVWESGRGLNQPVDFFNHPYPDAEGMTFVNALLTQSKLEAHQINFAVGNRGDYASRKTAQEVKTADKKEAELDSTQIVLFSTSWRETCNLGWLIYKSQLEIGTITLEGLDPLTLQKDLVLLAAGDTEVIQRQKTLNDLQNIWPIIGPTPAGPLVLEDILQLMVPNNADKYIQALQQGANNDKQLIAGLASVIEAIAQDHPEAIPPNSYEQLSALLRAAKQSASTPAAGNAPMGPQQQKQLNTPQAGPPTNSPQPQEQPAIQ
jgi:hypothetical protein